jgi:lysylphosphatidylglycerol synthetase-like protein (DUF2156 family)
MDTFDLDEEELRDLLRSAGKVAPSADFTQRMMARIDAAPTPELARKESWVKVPSRTVMLVLLIAFMGYVVFSLFLLPPASHFSSAIPRQWMVSPVVELLAGPVTLMALLSMALTVWLLVYLNRKVWKFDTVSG